MVSLAAIIFLIIVRKDVQTDRQTDRQTVSTAIPAFSSVGVAVGVPND